MNFKILGIAFFLLWLNVIFTNCSLGRFNDGKSVHTDQVPVQFTLPSYTNSETLNLRFLSLAGGPSLECQGTLNKTYFEYKNATASDCSFNNINEALEVVHKSLKPVVLNFAEGEYLLTKTIYQFSQPLTLKASCDKKPVLKLTGFSDLNQIFEFNNPTHTVHLECVSVVIE